MQQYQLNAAADDIAEAFDAEKGKDVWDEGTINALSPAPVIVGAGRHGRKLAPKFWGVPAPGGGPAAVLTARNLASPFWIGTLKHIELRCLVPATSFTLRGGGKSVECSVVSEKIFAMAGIWRDTTDYPAFAIITTQANLALDERGVSAMPVILDQAAQTRWLSDDWRTAQQLVDHLPSQLIHFS